MSNKLITAGLIYLAYRLFFTKKKKQAPAAQPNSQHISYEVTAEDGEVFTVMFDPTRHLYYMPQDVRVTEQNGPNGSDSFFITDNGKEYGMSIQNGQITIYEG